MPFGLKHPPIRSEREQKSNYYLILSSREDDSRGVLLAFSDRVLQELVKKAMPMDMIKTTGNEQG